MRSWALAVALLVGCSTHTGHLVRGQRLYQEHKFEEALAVWRVLELNAYSLSPAEQARYAYLRGMTDYRLGFRPDARHWLAVARAINKEHPGGLPQDWQARAEEALVDLNRDVFGARMPEANGGEKKGAATEAFEPVKCRSDADCKLEENCVAGVCAAPRAAE